MQLSCGKEPLRRRFAGLEKVHDVHENATSYNWVMKCLTKSNHTKITYHNINIQHH